MGRNESRPGLNQDNTAVSGGWVIILPVLFFLIAVTEPNTTLIDNIKENSIKKLFSSDIRHSVKLIH